MRTSKLVGAGIAPMAAANIASGFDIQTGVVAAGSTQATATAAYADTVIVGTTPASSGVIMSGPAYGPGDDQFFQNGGANALLIYPPSGAQINALGANAGYSLASAASVIVKCAGVIGGVQQFYTK